MMTKLNRPLVNEAKFYGAEMFMAANALHEEGFMHRNIQLSNFLVHSSGHLRVCDFGLSYQFPKPLPIKRGSRPKLSLITSPVYASAESSIPVTQTRSDSSKFKTTKSTDKITFASECTTSYLAPEVLRLLMPKTYFRLLKQKVGYSHLCDYWSLGVCLYHMMYGFLPFLPDSKGTIFDKVLDFRKTLAFPMGATEQVSVVGVSVIKELLKKEKKRLGRNNGIEEVKAHPYFTDVQWDYLGHGKVSVPVKESEMVRYLTPHSSVSSYTSSVVRTTRDEADSSDDSGDEEASFRSTILAQEMDFEMPMVSDPTVPCMQKRASLDSASQPGRFSVQDFRTSSLVGTTEVAPARASSLTKDMNSWDKSGLAVKSYSEGQTTQVKPGPSKAPQKAQKYAGQKNKVYTSKKGITDTTTATLSPSTSEGTSLQRRMSNSRDISSMSRAETTYVTKLLSWFQSFPDIAIENSPESSQDQL